MPTDTKYEDPAQAVVSTTLQHLYDEAHTRTDMIGGGTIFGSLEQSSTESDDVLHEWYPHLTFTQGHATQTDAPPIQQVGPLNTGYITFGGGVPVGGFSQLTLFQSGQFNFNGHFHVSGAPSYNVAFAVGVRSRQGVLYTFLRSGHLAGTFEPGSRDYDWSVQEFRAVIHDDWPNLINNSTWWWNAKVNWDPLALLGTIKTLAQTAGAVGQVVALL
ncbi:MAG: hypothetical protein JWQ67_2506 [Marmoricola sp.]|jgi:hypothetical protein|nr:hypothetical protein [Marmoricola sp.]